MAADLCFDTDQAIGKGTIDLNIKLDKNGDICYFKVWLGKYVISEVILGIYLYKHL